MATLRRYGWLLGLVACLAIVLLYVSPAQASGTVTVKGSAQNGWALVVETAPAGGYYESGPATPPAGTGSARLVLGNSNSSRMLLSMQGYAGIPLSALTELKYSTYRRSADAGNLLALALQFDMDYDLTDTTTAWQSRLVYEPYNSPGVSGTILQNTWYNWDALAVNARWWIAGTPIVNNVAVSNQCPMATPCDWATFLSYYPKAGIRAPEGYVHFKAGSYWPNFDGNVDKFIIGVNGDSTTYDFENETGCGSPCVITVKPSAMMGWVPIEETATGAASFVTGPGAPPLGVGSAQIDVSGNGGSGGGEYVMTPAYAGTALSTITTLQYSSLRQTADAGNSTTVHMQFDTDFDLTDANSSWQGRLVYLPANEPGVSGTILQNTWYTWDAIGTNARWWITGTPIVGGVAATNPCPLFGTTCSWATILSTFPDAGIHPVYQELGFKQGSGEGILTTNFDAFLIGVSGNQVEYDFEPDTSCTTDCYVNWGAGSDAYDGKTAATARHSFVSAIGSLTSGGTIHAANGMYIENVLIDKALTLIGASQAGVIVRPAISNPNCGGGGGGSLCANGSNIFLVQANNVTIHDLTVDGDNPALTSAYNVGGANLDARNGIITNHNAGTYNNLEVYNTTVKNIYLRGMYASSGGTFNFHDNTVTNVQAEYASIALFNFGGSGYYTNNAVSYANDGISSNWSTGTEYSNNTVTHSGSGIHTDNNGGFGGVADSIHDNTVSTCATNGYGIWVFAPYRAVTFNNNTVTDCAVGLTSAGQQAAVTPTFTNNTVNANSLVNSTGVYVTTSLFGYGSANVSATFTNNDILNNDTDGFYLEAEPGYVLTVNANNNNVTGNGDKGFSVNGDGTRNVTAHYNNISGNSGGAQSNRPQRKPQPPALPRSVNVSDDKSAVSVKTQSPRAPEAGTGTLDFTGNWWGNASGPTHTLNVGGTGDAVNDGVYYSPWLGIGTDTSGSVGFQPASPMTWIAHPDVCLPNTPNTKCIQQAIDLGAAGDSVTIHAGNFPEQVVINKANITLNGAGSSSTIIKPNTVTANTTKLSNGASADAILLIDGVSGVSIQSLRVDGSTAAFNACTPEYYGVYFRNGAGTLNNSDIRNVYHPSAGGCQGVIGVLVHSNTGSNAVNLTNNSITNYGKNGVTCNLVTGATSLTCNVTGNTVTGRGPLGSGEAAQNGVQIGFGATGVVNGNTISNNSYTPFTTIATGILLYQADADAANNTLSENQVGLYLLEGSGTYDGNTISATAGGTGSSGFYGIILDAPPPWHKPQPVDAKALKSRSKNGPTATQTLVVTNNTLTSNGSSGGIGLEADAGYGANNMNITANYNVVRNWGAVGMEFVQCTGAGCTGSTFIGVIAHHNRIVGNGVGMETSTCTGATCSAGSIGITVDAENNWWGCNYGPGNTGAGCPVAANDATGSVDTSPYLVLKNSISPTTINAYGASSHAADLRYNSNNSNTSGSGYIPNSTPVSWSATLGSMSPTSNGTSSGTASSTFTSNGTTGTASLSVTVDGQTLSGDVNVQAPTVALISRFKGKQDGAQVKLVWDTASEINLSGFNVWRARGKGEYVKLNAEPIATLNPGNTTGNTYTYFDPLSKKGRYHYKLELLTTGDTQFTERISVRFKPDTNGCAAVVDKAQQLSPKNKAVVRGKGVQFDWGELACATRYEFTLRANSADGAVLVNESNLQSSAYDIARLKAGVYFWSVRGCNAAGCGPARIAQFTLERNKD